MTDFSFPTVLPYNWQELDRAEDGRRWIVSGTMTVIASVSSEADGMRWVHVSCARRSRLPDWEDLKHVKETVLGDRWAVQVFTPREEWVNTHNFCLHVWHCLDKRVIPDFRKAGQI